MMRAIEEEYLAAQHFELKSAVFPYKMSLIYELFRRVLPNDVTLSKSTSFFHGSALTDMCCHQESAD